MRSAHEDAREIFRGNARAPIERSVAERIHFGRSPRPRRLEKLRANSVSTFSLRGEAIVRLSRLMRETLDKLPFPEDVVVAVDVDPYQLL